MAIRVSSMRLRWLGFALVNGPTSSATAGLPMEASASEAAAEAAEPPVRSTFDRAGAAGRPIRPKASVADRRVKGSPCSRALTRCGTAVLP
jgi:hypothetical protein